MDAIGLTPFVLITRLRTRLVHLLKRLLALGALAPGLFVLSACGGGGSSSAVLPSTSTPGTSIQSAATSTVITPLSNSTFARGLAAGYFQPVCGVAAADEARCFSYLLTDAGRGALAAGVEGRSATSGPTSGYGPTQLQAAYGTAAAAAANGSGKTVAIVDAYNDPDAASDLNTYRTYYGLPSCTTANGCFKQVSQTGSTTALPANNGSWAEEESLDIDMVSANCPKCNIVLVEATSPTNANLRAAVNYAATISGVVAISNSYGGSESSSDPSYISAYTHPNIAITASNGDSGYGVETPASYGTVTAVGGTTLTAASGTARGYTETVWDDSGSGCSKYETKPTWQKDTGCTKRTVGDVAYEGDPNTGVAVYDSYSYEGYSGWLVFGGTSVGAPSIGAIYALSANTTGTPAALAYANTTSLNDVTSGSNGTCSVAYLCNGEVGYDAPTGNGTPKGTGAF